MDLQDFKRWHWLVIGLILGLLLGGIRLYWGPAYLDSTARTLSQEQFERSLLRPSGAMRLSGLTLHPPEDDGTCWVTGQFSEDRSYTGPGGDNAGPRSEVRVSGPFKYRALADYKPRFWIQGMPHGQMTLPTYLDAVASRLPRGQVSYRYAWDEHKSAVLVAWAGATVILVGVLWPIVLSILSGAGLGRRASEAREPAIIQQERAALPSVARPVEPPDEEQLAAFAEILERQAVALAPSPGPATVEPPPPAPVPQLKGERLQAVDQPREEEKHYAGDFYPTTAHASESDRH